MNEEEIRAAARKEKQKITRELKKAKISPHKMKILEATIENVALMKAKLDEMREDLLVAKAVVEYDNGGGQKGVRENPVFKRYESFFKTYTLGMSEIFATANDEEDAGKDKIDDSLKPQTVLGMVQEKQRTSA